MESNSVWNDTFMWLTKLDDHKAGVQFVNYEYDYRHNWKTKSPVTN